MQLPESLNLHVEGHLSASDAARQRRSAQAILSRFEHQPGIILGDEVGMGKTFVALAVASASVVNDPSRPVVIMVPRGVVGKWGRDSETFRVACLRDEQDRRQFRVMTAETGVEFLKLLDDPEEIRATVIILAHGALNRRLADGWVKLAVLQAAIKGRHGVEALRIRLARFAPMVIGQAKVVDEKYDLFLQLLETPASQWKRILVKAQILKETDDDPVPEHFLNALEHVDLTEVLERVVNVIPERTSANIKDRIREARNALDSSDKGVLPAIWITTLKRMNLSLPLLVLDEAHRVRNAGTQLAQLLSETREDLDTAGQLAGRFDRMLFLTATPFQLGHAELRNVLARFEAIAWDCVRAPKMNRNEFKVTLDVLHARLNTMQVTTDRLERAWKRLHPADVKDATDDHGELWWVAKEDDRECLGVSNERIRLVMLAFRNSLNAIQSAQECLKPWVLRNSRSRYLPEPYQTVLRRERLEGASVLNNGDDKEISGGGLRISPENALPFLLAARITTLPGCPRVFGEGVASSYEALLDTHREEMSEKIQAKDANAKETARGLWYVERLRMAARAMGTKGHDLHPKIKATVDLAMALWLRGEKVLIFCHYRQTGSALHRYLSEAMLTEIESRASRQIGCAPEDVSAELKRIADGLDRDRPAARKVVEILNSMSDQYEALKGEAVRNSLQEIMLRFLRTPTFLVRFADLSGSLRPDEWVTNMFRQKDASGLSLEDVTRQFLDFLSKRAGESDRMAYLSALQQLQTGSHAGPEVEQSYADYGVQTGERARLVANVRRVYGDTRQETRDRIMLTFNTPFYPEILISSSVMAEGVDLHLNCRHVIHHDLDWNPSSLEQRTGRIDRLGAKAERSGHSIRVYLPYLEGCQDEKLFRVVMDRERWFGVVMGAEESMARVLKYSPWELERMSNEEPIPVSLVERLQLQLSI
jgi:superfamily II DNA or RNA helicase